MTQQNQPRISVITCTFNSEHFLEQALQSVENQTYKNIEHIINDSHSTDTTLRIIADYIKRNGHQYPIKVIQCEPKGVGNALNVATASATGEIIHYLHSDDYYIDPNALERVARHFDDNPDLVWLTGNFAVEWKRKRIVLPQTLILKPNLEIALSIMNFISHENTFMKTEAVQQYGGFIETKDEPVEYSLWLKLQKFHRPLIVNDEFAVFIIHKGSTSTGSVFKLLKAVRRAYHTQKKEHILPLLGFYREKRVYRYIKMWFKRISNLLFL